MDQKQAVSQTDAKDFPLLKRGKVRDVHDVGEHLLIVATDRISCFDVVLPTPVPGKGRILTEMSRFWFERTRDIIPNHLFDGDPREVLGDSDLAAYEGQSMLVEKAEPLPIEAVVRGYLSGSGWKEYRQNGTVCGIELPKGLEESAKLPEPIFTPATKAPEGLHDENISFEQMSDIVGVCMASTIRKLSLQLYVEAAEHAAKRGIIIADTKVEFGLIDGRLTLIDEVLTPDSSRFWPVDRYQTGSTPPSFDKQYVRDYLVEIGWDKEPPAPELPAEVVEKTSQKYTEALRQLCQSVNNP